MMRFLIWTPTRGSVQFKGNLNDSFFTQFTNFNFVAARISICNYLILWGPYMFYANSALSIHGHITLILGKFSHEIHPPPFSCLLNSHVDKMGSQGPKHYGFGDHLVWVPEKTKLEQYSQLFVNSVH